jgi:hypothetical protein
MEQPITGSLYISWRRAEAGRLASSRGLVINSRAVIGIISFFVNIRATSLSEGDEPVPAPPLSAFGQKQTPPTSLETLLGRRHLQRADVVALADLWDEGRNR